MKPEDEPSIDRQKDPPEVLKKKKLLGQGVVVVLGVFLLGAFSLYIAIVVYGLANSS